MSAKVLDTYQATKERALEFLSKCGNPNTVPVSVYSPFSHKKLAEIQLIREISGTLQEKKVEEDRAAAAAAAEDAKEKEAQKKRGNEEQPTEELTKDNK